MTVTATPPRLAPQVLFPSAIRSGTQSVVVANPGWDSFVFWCDVTVNPGGAETIFLDVNGLIGGTFISLGQTAASALGGVAGTLTLIFGTGVVIGYLGGTVSAIAPTLPLATLAFTVGVSGAGLWTYSAGVDGFYR